MFLLWLFRKVWNSIALSISTHAEAEGQSASGLGGSGVALIRDGFTSRGFVAFSPWNDSSYAKSMLQIYLGHSALALMDVINLGVLSNFSRQEFWLSPNYDQRYHMEKQPQFTGEVASDVFLSVNGPNYAKYDLLKSPLISLPPHQKIFKLYCYFLIA